MSVLSGPMFEGDASTYWESSHGKRGGHCNTFRLRDGVDSMAALRSFFDGGEADEFNICLFSTSGVHGTYHTIEEVEQWIGKPDPAEESEEYALREVTFLIVQPRICTVRYGNCRPENADDIAFLKRLRESSWKQAAKIGAPSKS